MGRPKYTYAVEAQRGADWLTIADDETRDFCLGYLAALRQCPGPRLAVRVTRSDGRLCDESGAVERVGLGMVAGWPTAEQYERAAERALEQAREVRARSTLQGRSF
jgi:hypothetical protein